MHLKPVLTSDSIAMKWRLYAGVVHLASHMEKRHQYDASAESGCLLEEPVNKATGIHHRARNGEFVDRISREEWMVEDDHVGGRSDSIEQISRLANLGPFLQPKPKNIFSGVRDGSRRNIGKDNRLGPAKRSHSPLDTASTSHIEHGSLREEIRVSDKVLRKPTRAHTLRAHDPWMYDEP
jgi:hypothetical protein